ncbi:MAG: exodeoxyribonuclease VII small subunit [Oscillospiraceae bacterium]|nr:exodeoxyribonuclease VII small subunit [Oscillospiraceae bacterium]MBQ9982639.1 exodeoxyribonuclease VII small subunit [Oscillospiraceae bacterium]
MSFEDKMKKLEEIVTSLESGNLTLDKAVEMYSEGMKLSLDCKTELENAKLKITSVKSGGNDVD